MLSAERVKRSVRPREFFARWFSDLPDRRRVNVPCPFHEDTNPSFSLDLETGLWRCFDPACSAHRGGDVFSFWMLREGGTFPEAVEAVGRMFGIEEETPHARKLDRERAQEPEATETADTETPPNVGRQNPSDGIIPDALVEQWVRRLRQESLTPIRTALQTYRGWSEETLGRFEVGWDGERYTIPVRDAEGACRNVRRYCPSPTGDSPKFLNWKNPADPEQSYGETRLFPFSVLSESPPDSGVILCEGETDTMTAWEHGFRNALTQTAGAGTWKEAFTGLLAGRSVWIVYDVDDAGRQGAAKVAATLRDVCDVYDVLLPLDIARFPHGDLSDYLRTEGVLAFRDLLESAMPTPKVTPRDFEWGAAHCPPDWLLTEEGVFRLLRKRVEGEWIETPVLLASAPVWVSGAGWDSLKSQEYVELTGRTMAGWTTELCESGEVFDRNRLLKLSDRGFPFDSENATKMTAYLNQYLRRNLAQYEPQRLTHQCGWHEENGVVQFVLGKENVAFVGKPFPTVIRGEPHHVGGLSSLGTTDEWRDRFFPVMEDSLLARLYVYCSLAAPLLKGFGVRSFLFHNVAESGSGKTACQKLAASVWGDPSVLVASLNATQVYVERHCVFFSDLPVFFDELQLRTDEDFRQRIVYMIPEERGRGRGTREGGMREVSTWRTVAVTTGEQHLTTERQLGGQDNRVLEVFGKPLDSATIASRVHREVEEVYGVMGREYLARLREVNFSEWKAVWKSLREAYETELGDRMGRGVLDALSLVTIAGTWWERWFGGRSIDAETILDELLPIFSESERRQTFAWRAYRFLNEWISSRSDNFERPGSDPFDRRVTRTLPARPCLGYAPYVDEEGHFCEEIWVISKTLREEMERQNFGEYRRAILDWKRAGLFKGYATEYVNGNLSHVLKIKLGMREENGEVSE